MIMVSDDVRKMAQELKQETGDTAYNCRKALMYNGLDMENAREYLKKFTFDSHGFKVDKQRRDLDGRPYY